MADITTLIKAPTIKMKDFNKELREACQEAPITDYHAAVVDGQPCIVLISNLVDATAEDVANAEADGVPLKLGDPIPESDPLVVQVVALGAYGTAAADSMKLCDVLAQRANGQAEDPEIISGPTVGWSHSPDDIDPATGSPRPNARMVMFQSAAAYLVISYLAPAGETEDA
jgi:hypothetical protein